MAEAVEEKFRRYCDGHGGICPEGMLQIRHEDDDLEMHDKDRHYVCDRLAGSLEIRCSSALSDPIVESFKIFIVVNWPSAECNEGEDLEEYGNNRLLALIDIYSTWGFRGDRDSSMLKVVKATPSQESYQNRFRPSSKALAI